ncbi:MFS transporter [Acetobacter senegalensis]|uniref:MFS transporter n=1 Tax=Acetobacter senegalensis TaxID=446692 RepID=UPI00209C9E2A|nr:MFS transporter [Acetobacter senegalensis]MCP1196073.1 MFS transporter [Acetobacter senegalensis]
MHPAAMPFDTPKWEPVPYWRLWAACFLGYAAIGMTIQVMPAYVHSQFGTGAIGAGTAVTVGSLATMLVRPFAGLRADLHGGRNVAVAGAFLALIAGIGHLMATTLPLLILARLALGAGEGALFTASVGWVLTGASQTERGRIAGHFGLSMWFGLAAGPILGAAILSVSAYRDVWIAASLFPTLACLLLLQTPRSSEIKSTQAGADRSLLPRAAWVPGISNIFASIGYGVIAAFLVPRFHTLHLIGQDFALAAFGAAFMTTRFIGSSWVDRFGAKSVLLVALLIQAAGLGGLYFIQTSFPAFIFTALTASGLSMLYPCLASLVTQAAAPHERSTAIGAVTSAWDLGLAAGGPLGGLVVGTTNAGPFALGAVSALIATLPILAFGRSSSFLSGRRQH